MGVAHAVQYIIFDERFDAFKCTYIMVYTVTPK